MIDAQKLLEQLLGRPAPEPPGGRPSSGLGGAIPDSLKGFGGGFATGGLAGLLLGSKGGRKLAESALKAGGVAVIGGLAYKAWRDWQATAGGSSTVSRSEAAAAGEMKDITPKPEGTRFLPSARAERDALGLKLVQAMIAAAKADGHIDAAEQGRIFARLDDLALDTEEKAFVIDELRRPLDVDAVVRLAGSPEEAAEIYAASCLAIDPDDAAEQAYLALLAARLRVPAELKTQIERAVASAAG